MLDLLVMPSNRSSQSPQLTVVVPICDSRYSVKNIRTWTNQKNVAPYDFEILIICAENEFETHQESLIGILREHDRIIASPDPREALLYQIGGRAVNTPLILFTEDHCCAASTCVAEVLNGFDSDPNLDAVYLKAGHINRSLCAACENREYDDFLLQQWGMPGVWNLVRLRGFALKTDIYRKTEGFHPDYDLFSEEILSARLNDVGCETCYLEKAQIFHINTSLQETFEHTTRFVYHRDMFIDDMIHADPKFLQKYWSSHVELAFHRRGYRSTIQKSLCLLKLRHVWFSLSKAKSIQRSFHHVSQIPRMCLPPRWINRLRYHKTIRKLDLLSQQFSALAKDQVDEGHPIYLKIREHIIQKTNLQYCLDHPHYPNFKISKRTGWAASDLDISNVCAGFFPLETHEQLQFRWASDLSLLKLRAPAGAYTLWWETGSLMGASPDFRCEFYIDGNYSPHQISGSHLQVHVVLTDSPFYLGMICHPASKGNATDRRCLGIPLTQIRLTPVV